jgi:hypothetical protein
VQLIQLVPFVPTAVHAEKDLVPARTVVRLPDALLGKGELHGPPAIDRDLPELSDSRNVCQERHKMPTRRKAGAVGVLDVKVTIDPK